MKRENEIYQYVKGSDIFAFRVSSIDGNPDMEGYAPITAVAYHKSIIKIDEAEQKKYVHEIELNDDLLSTLEFKISTTSDGTRQHFWTGMLQGELKTVRLISGSFGYKLDTSLGLQESYSLPFDSLSKLQTLNLEFLSFELPINLSDISKHIGEI